MEAATQRPIGQRIKTPQEIKPFKIRCSSIGSFMGSNVGLSDAAKRDLDFLRDKAAGKIFSDKTGRNLPITAKEKEKLKGLEDEAAKPPEPTPGMKTILKDFAISQMFNKKKQSKGGPETDKGDICESAGVQMVVDYLDLGFAKKHVGRVSSEFIEGECDVLLKNCIIDIKNSFTCHTFPLFDGASEVESNYWWQGQGYMYLYNRKEYKIAYVLLDMPEELLWDMARKASYQIKNKGKLMEEIYLELLQLYTYEDYDIQDRIKIFTFKRNDEAIEKIIERVKLGREYIKTLKYERVIEAIPPKF